MTGFSTILPVLVPTRELAKQISAIANKFGSCLGIKSTALYGGTKDPSQLSDIEAGCELVVATPGRLIDMMNSSDINLQHCSFVVLDEGITNHSIPSIFHAKIFNKYVSLSLSADKMLDMGFEKFTRRIVSSIRADCQKQFWSATMPDNIQPLADYFMNDQTYLRLQVGEILSANPNIRQNVYVCDEHDKLKIFECILDDIAHNDKAKHKTLIFVKTASMAKCLVGVLKQRGITADAIYGSRLQYEREAILNSFNNDALDMLVGTIVLSRGLDIKNIENVILYDFPPTCADYINQIGRTARGGSNGVAYTLFTRFVDQANAKDLVSILETSKQEVDAELIEIVERVKSRKSDSPQNGRKKRNW